MAKYRKSDEYYHDQYDRHTIEGLKEYETLMGIKLNDEPKNLQDKMKQVRVQDYAIQSAREKRATIEGWKQKDEQRDRMIARHPVPMPPTCLCGKTMLFFDYDFFGPQDDIHFIYTCKKCRNKNQIIDQYGEAYLPPAKSCSYCNGNLVSKVTKSKGKIILVDTCEDCDRAETLEFDIPKPIKLKPIDENERAYYCTDIEHRRTFYEDLKALVDLADEIKVKPDLSKIEMLKLPQLERRLSEMLHKSNFYKLTLQQPKISDVITVVFSVEDNSDRSDRQSSKELKRLLTAEIQRTNWRLMSTEIVSRMGYLSGQLKGFDQSEHLNKLIKEIEMSDQKQRP